MNTISLVEKCRILGCLWDSNQRKHKYFIFCLLIALFLSACTETPTDLDFNNDSITMNLPERLVLSLPKEIEMSAKITFTNAESDAGSQTIVVPLEQMNNGTTLVGDTELMVGTYDFDLVLNAKGPFFENVPVLRYPKTEITISGSTTTSTTLDPYEYSLIDSDGDGYSTLFELKSESNPTDKDAYPAIRRVFLTSVAGTANLHGDAVWPSTTELSHTSVENGNAICNALANEAGLQDSGFGFRAWLSSSGVHPFSNSASIATDAICNVNGLSGKYSNTAICGGDMTLGQNGGGRLARLDGEIIANSIEELLGGEMVLPINVSEDGKYLNDTGRVGNGDQGIWTLSDERGKYSSAFFQELDPLTGNSWTALSGACSDMHSGELINHARIGYPWSTGERWGSAHFAKCNEEHRLLCIEQPISLESVIPPPPVVANESGSLIFATSETYKGDQSDWPTSSTGHVGVNDICNQHADRGGFGEKRFEGLVPRNSEDILRGRFANVSFPIKRLDDRIVAFSTNDLFAENNTILAPINMDENGEFIRGNVVNGAYQNSVFAWTGLERSDGQADSGHNCGYFGNNTIGSNEKGKVGIVTSTRNSSLGIPEVYSGAEGVTPQYYDGWLSYRNSMCTNSHRFYCLQVD